MFRKPLPLKVAGVLGLGAGLFYVLFAVEFATQIQSLNPYAEQDWRDVLEQQASNAGPTILTQSLVFLASILLLFFIAGLASQAAKRHPTTAGMAGIFMGAAAGMLALRALWIAFVQIPMAITFHGSLDQTFRTALVNQYRVDVFASLFFAWGYIFFMAVGLLLMAGALLPQKYLAYTLPITFGLAALSCLTFIPALAYVGNQLFMARLFDRELASAFFFAAWFLPGLAFLNAGSWLIREGFRDVAAEEITDLHLEQTA
jgi:hypothetical protein